MLIRTVCVPFLHTRSVAWTLLLYAGFVIRRGSVFPKAWAVGGNYPLGFSGGNVPSLAWKGSGRIDAQSENQDRSCLSGTCQADEHHRNGQGAGGGFAQRQPERHQGSGRESSPGQRRHGCLEEVEI